jgi:hypothetical protein
MLHVFMVGLITTDPYITELLQLRLVREGIPRPWYCMTEHRIVTFPCCAHDANYVCSAEVPTDQ